FSGNASFDNVPATLQGTLHDQSASTTLTTPDTVAIAVASRPIKSLVVDAEVVWTNWSRLQSIVLSFGHAGEHRAEELEQRRQLPRRWRARDRRRVARARRRALRPEPRTGEHARAGP